MTLAVPASRGLLRSSSWDLLLIGLSLGHGALLCLWPTAMGIAIGLWWAANTISHNFIHNPFFQSRAMNRAYSFYLTLALGVPQALWRDRHLAHHAGRTWRWRGSRQLHLECALLGLLWLGLLLYVPLFLVTVYLPGLAGGLLLCGVHGYYEHRGGGTTGHHGRLYNLVFFNDGFHAHHHSRPGRHWTAVATGPRSPRSRSLTPTQAPGHRSCAGSTTFGPCVSTPSTVSSTPSSTSCSGAATFGPGFSGATRKRCVPCCRSYRQRRAWR